MEYNTGDKFPKQFAFAKDLSGKFILMNENFAECAGFDSPGQGVGLTDRDAIWREQADLFQQGDLLVYKGSSLLNKHEDIQFSHTPAKTRRIVTTKAALRDNSNNVIGMIGSFIDITDHHISKKPGSFDPKGKRFVFNGALSGLILNKKQMTILEYIIRGYSAAEIGQLLSRSKRTIEGHIEYLKDKLQCNSKAEIIRWAIVSGLGSSSTELL